MLTILLTIISIAFIITLLAFIAPTSRIRDLLERFMLIIQGPFAIMRDTCRTVLQKSWEIIKKAATSVGITGDHWVQRVVGMVIISIASLLGLSVGILNLMVVIGGLFGSAADTILEYLPLSLEMLTAIELAVAGFIFGFLLLDTLGISHTLKFYSKDYLVPWMRYAFASIFLIGGIYSVYLFAVSGVVRKEAIFSEGYLENEQLTVSDLNTESIIIDPDHQTFNLELIEDFDLDIGLNSSEEYEAATSRILIGVPMISMASGIFSGVALIPALAMIFTLPPYLCILLLFGLTWAFGSFWIRIIDLIYNFILAFTNFFADIGESIRKRITNRTLIGEQNTINSDEVANRNNTNISINNEDTKDSVADVTDDNSNDINDPMSMYNPQSNGQEDELHEIYTNDDPGWNPIVDTKEED